MNLVGKKHDAWCIVSVIMGVNGNYVVKSTFLHSDGTLRVSSVVGEFSDLNLAIEKAKSTFGWKVKRKGFIPKTLGDLPNISKKYLSNNVSDWISPEEMQKLIEKSRHERYVFFSVVSGLDERFNLDVEYIGYVDLEDNNFIYVHDNYGEICRCYVGRFSKITLTERAIEVNEKVPSSV